MQKELNPALFYGALAVVALGLIIAGYVVLGPKRFVAQTTGSEKDMKRVLEKGEPMYRPPAGVPGISMGKSGMPSGAPGTAPGTGPGMPPMAPSQR